MKKQTHDVLRAVYDSYQRMLLDRMASELALVDKFRIEGNTFEVNRHFQLAEIFKSILDNHILYGPVTPTTDPAIVSTAVQENNMITNAGE